MILPVSSKAKCPPEKVQTKEPIRKVAIIAMKACFDLKFEKTQADTGIINPTTRR